MIKSRELKEQLLAQLHKLLDEKIESAKHSLFSAKESRDSDTKSSAGDKYETGRAMMQMEVEKYQVQLGKLLSQKSELDKINSSRTYSKAEFGCLIICDSGNYFLSISVGKVEVQNESYYCLSVASPIGMALLGKFAGDQIQFQGKEIVIKELI